MTKDSGPFESHHSFNGEIEIYILQDVIYSIRVIALAIAPIDSVSTMFELHY